MSETIKEVEIFGVGEWQGMNMKKSFKFTLDMLKRIATNSLKVKNKMPIKLGHNNKQILSQSDGQPALGWLENIKIKGNKIVADLVNVPDILLKSIKKQLFKQVSVELGNTQGIGPHVTGLAVLGADLPAVKTLKDLDQYFTTNNEHVESEINLCFTEPNFKEDIMSKENEDFEAALNFKAEKAAFEVRVKELEAKEASFKEAALEGLFTSSKKEIMLDFKKQAEDGKLMPHMLDKIERDLDSQKVNFSQSSDLSLSFATIKELSEAYAEVKKGEVLTQAGEVEQGSIDEIVEKKVFSVMESSNINYNEASNLVFSTNPELLKQYQDQALIELGLTKEV